MTISRKLTLKELIKRPICFLALGFGAGLSRKAPGTVGTLFALPIYWLMQHLETFDYLVLVILGFFAGIWICQQAVKWLEKEDPSEVVWDEIIGYLVTMIAAPPGWGWMLLGFVLFRLFDVWKPWPISFADRRLHGGLGIMLDDIIAGIFAAILLQIAVVML